MCPTKAQNQPVHLRGLIRVFVVHMKKLCIIGYQNIPSEDSDKTVQMRRLIQTFVVRIRQKVRFLTLCSNILFIESVL